MYDWFPGRQKHQPPGTTESRSRRRILKLSCYMGNIIFFVFVFRNWWCTFMKNDCDESWWKSRGCCDSLVRELALTREGRKIFLSYFLASFILKKQRLQKWCRMFEMQEQNSRQRGFNTGTVLDIVVESRLLFHRLSQFPPPAVAPIQKRESYYKYVQRIHT